MDLTDLVTHYVLLYFLASSTENRFLASNSLAVTVSSAQQFLLKTLPLKTANEMYFVRFSACFELRERDWDLLNRSFISNHYNQSGTRLYLGLSLPRLFWRGGPGSKVSRLVLVLWKRQLWYTKHIAYYQKLLNSYLCKVLY